LKFCSLIKLVVIVICQLFSIKTDPEFLLKNSQMHDSAVNSAIAIPSKTNQQITIAIALYSFFSTKDDRYFGITQKIDSEEFFNQYNQRLLLLDDAIFTD
jgi:LytS/YehU family sensor histidine kinase